MGNYTKKTFANKLEQRLKTQNRKLTIDGNIIFIFPYFEGHYSTVDKIVYYVNDNKADKRYIKDLKSLSFVNNKVQIIFDDDSTGNLYYKNKKGDLICAEQDDLGIGKVSIDHTPSIYIVLYMMYISENPDFDLLVDFSKELIASTTEVINTAFMKKTKTFNKLVDDVLQNNR